MKTNLLERPASATDLVHLADSFILPKSKATWRRKWDNFKAGEIARWQGMRSGERQRWKLKTPGNYFILNLSINTVRGVKMQRYGNSASYARKAMVRTGISFNLNGL